MLGIRALGPALAAGCMVVASLSAVAQTAPSRTRVDARALVPGPQASDAAGESRPAADLTRDQRKDATLKARQEGALRPAGEAPDLRGDRPAPVAAATPETAAPPSAVAAAAAPTVVATAPTPPKKRKKKARAAAAPA